MHELELIMKLQRKHDLQASSRYCEPKFHVCQGVTYVV